MNTENRNNSNICVIWTRVSTKHQEANGGSLDHQRTICEDYAKEEMQDSMTLLKRKLSEAERQIHDTKVRYGTGKIDDDIFSVAIQELEDRKGEILLELEKCRNTLSNTESEVSEIVATCCKLGSLWLNADLGTKVKLQNLVFLTEFFGITKKPVIEHPKEELYLR